MPKRKLKKKKPKKKLGKKKILLPPVIVGAATLAGILIMHFIPHPPILDVCLKKHAVDTFNVYPRVQIIVDGHKKLMPDDIGKLRKEGKECLSIIHTDAVGDVLHVQYIRPIRLTIDDFMKIYSHDNRTILVIKDFNVDYSYFSEKGEFTRVSKPSDIPPFTNDLVVRMHLSSK